MPYLPRVKNSERQEVIKRLMSEVAKGPMAITPVMQKQVKSKLKTRVIQRSAEERLESSRRMAKKMGGLI